MNKKPRKISDGQKSGSLSKLVKRIVKKLKRFWKRKIHPTIKSFSLKNQNKILKNKVQKGTDKCVKRQGFVNLKLICAGCICMVIAVVVSAMVMKYHKEEQAKIAALIEQADVQAAMYDYDTAVEIIKGYEKDYTKKEELTAAIQRYEETKASCRPFPIDQVTHIFFHVMIESPEEAFGKNSQMPVGLNQYMATMDELEKVINSMYEKGYVLVSLSDVAPATTDADGNTTFSEGEIMLPPGKKAFVLSQDDVCYYHSYEHSGMAEKLVLDENGEVKTQYTDANGNTEIGIHDMVPYIDAFVEEHPDFTYKGAKGILAFTGYNGILGYRTDLPYKETKDRDRHQQKWLDEHPDFDYEKECEDAKKVAAALKADGWEFASHSWGHMWQNKIGDRDFDIDAKKWMERVAPLIGGANIWIYSNGEDVDSPGYRHRFETLRNYGFQYFCPVNSAKYSTEIYDDYVKQGRRNIDGYRMYYDMIDDDTDRLSDLFDVEAVFDTKRPTPVPQI